MREGMIGLECNYVSMGTSERAQKGEVKKEKERLGGHGEGRGGGGDGAHM